MSAPIDDGGPAYPWEDVKDTAGEPRPTPGMSLRDHFAGQILAGCMANPSDGYLKFSNRQEDLVDLAGLYYRMADAMIAARKGGPES